MRNVTHPEASGYERTQTPANAAAAFFPKSERNHPLGAARLTSVRHQSPKNEVDHVSTIANEGQLDGDPASSERSLVIAILREAYRVARGERQRIKTDLNLLVGIARALEADIYDPAFALERAVEHGLVAWPDVEVTP